MPSPARSIRGLSISRWARTPTGGTRSSTTPTSPTPSIYLVLEGFTPTQLGSTKPSFETGGNSFSNLFGVTLSIGTAIHEQNGLPNTPQRILFPCGVNFGAMPDSGLFPLPPAFGPNVYPLTATINIQGQSTPLAATTAFEL